MVVRIKTISLCGCVDIRDFIFQDLSSHPSDYPAIIEMKTINKWDVGSVESSDTYASCNTHIFASQGDLTADESQFTVSPMYNSNLYVNPLTDYPYTPATKMITTVVTSDSSPLQHQIFSQERMLKSYSSSSSLESESYEEPTCKMEDDANTGVPLLPRAQDLRMKQDTQTIFTPPIKKPRFLQSIMQRPRFDGNRESSLSSLDSLSSMTGSLTGKPKIGAKTPFSSLILGRFGRKSKSLLLTDSPQKSQISSPDTIKKKSILKKSDNGHKEEQLSEQLTKAVLRKTKEMIDDNFQNNNTSFSTSPLLSPSIKSSSLTRQPLKAIGPKMGPKPHAQPIKFVGVEVTSSQMLSPAISSLIKSPIPRISGVPSKSLQHPNSIDTDQNVSWTSELPSYSLPLHCTNLSCTYNQVAHCSQSEITCYCGNRMECTPIITESSPLTTSPASNTDSNIPLKVPLVSVDVDSTDVVNLNKLNEEKSGIKSSNTYTQTPEIISLPQQEYLNGKESQ